MKILPLEGGREADGGARRSSSSGVFQLQMESNVGGGESYFFNMSFGKDSSVVVYDNIIPRVRTSSRLSFSILLLLSTIQPISINTRCDHHEANKS